MTNKLVEDFRLKIKGIFKESATAFEAPPVVKEDEVPAVAPETAPVSTDAAAAPAPEGEVEEKVTLTVSLLKSLLDWAHGEEEAEGEEVAPEGEAPAAEATPAPVVEAEEPAAEVAPEGEEAGEELQDAGVEAIEIEALVNKVKELGQTKEVLTDEDFGEIVAAAQAAEEGSEGEGLEGVLDGEAAPEADLEAEITEEIGKIAPAGIKNDGNKGIGK
jgi:hypothetical protein